MAYVPLSGYLTQLITQTGQVASDYYIKFYIANTTTPLSMATNRGASTLLVKAKFNNNGMPITNPLDNSTEFIPHLNQAYRLVVYRNEADADADNTADSYVNIPEIYALLSASNIGAAADQIPQNGDFGTAARVDTGTGANDVPLNSDLGSASLVDTGLLTGNVPTANQLSMVGQTVNYTGANYQPANFDGLNAVRIMENNSAVNIVFDGVVSSSSLRYCRITNGSVLEPLGTAVSGSWKNVTGATIAPDYFGMFVRIA
mgnify:CR=1 FL=1|tara:strand:- start:2048 stop:2824 length:777 start_codon:yes stop_codon:yes gene_type:complete